MCKYSYKIQLYLRVIFDVYGRTHHDYGRTQQKIDSYFWRLIVTECGVYTVSV
jgi:hypothetical protein